MSDYQRCHSHPLCHFDIHLQDVGWRTKTSPGGFPNYTRRPLYGVHGPPSLQTMLGGGRDLGKQFAPVVEQNWQRESI